MPTITCSYKDLTTLLGKQCSVEQLRSLLEHAKGEVESVIGDELTIKFNDTNQPWLWSVEGVAVLLRGILGVEAGIFSVKLGKPSREVHVEKSVKGVRSFISAFLAKGVKVSEPMLAQFIQAQEKIADVFGRKRSKVAIGLYPSRKIEFPVLYRAVDPRSVRFVPLGYFEEMNLSEIVTNHPKGKEYGVALAGLKKFPVLVSSSREVLSFPPIINSASLGKVDVGESELFFEVTGTDETAVDLVASIFAMIFSVRGFGIEPVKIKTSGKSKVTPLITPTSWKLPAGAAERVIGISLSESEKRSLFRKMRCEYSKGTVLVPAYRDDILHVVDIVEDLAIAYGIDNLESLPLTESTIGRELPLVPLIDSLRGLLVGAGFQESFSQMLTSDDILYDRMSVQDFGTVRISNASSSQYAVVRSWILPQLLELLSKNKHVLFPQKVFEQGTVAVKTGADITEYERIAFVTSHSSITFTEGKQVIDFLLSGVGVSASFVEMEHKSFIPGRVASVVVDGKRVAFVGEIHPSVLNVFSLETPVVGMELNVTMLSEVMKEGKKE